MADDIEVTPEMQEELDAMGPDPVDAPEGSE